MILLPNKSRLDRYLNDRAGCGRSLASAVDLFSNSQDSVISLIYPFLPVRCCFAIARQLRARSAFHLARPGKLRPPFSVYSRPVLPLSSLPPLVFLSSASAPTALRMLAQSALPLLLLVLSAFVAASPAPLDRVSSDLVFMETLHEIESWDVGTKEREDGRESGDKGDIEGRELGACGELNCRTLPAVLPSLADVCCGPQERHKTVPCPSEWQRSPAKSANVLLVRAISLLCGPNRLRPNHLRSRLLAALSPLLPYQSIIDRYGPL